MNIGIFNALSIFCNPNVLHIRIEKKAGNYVVTICHEGSIICRWSPPARDEKVISDNNKIENVILDNIERLLKVIIVYGRGTYFEKGTFLYNWYNVTKREIPEDLVLSQTQVEEIVANLRYQIEHPKVEGDSPSSESEVFVGAIVPQEITTTVEVHHV